MTEHDIRMNVITLDFGNELGEDEDSEDEEEEEQRKSSKGQKPEQQETPAQIANKELLVELTSKIKGAVFPASIAMQIYSQFKKREVAARTKFRGTMDIS